MKPIFKYSLLTLALGLSHTATASYIRTDISLQTYRDFAENKGQFTAGNHNIAIYNVQGSRLGNLPSGVPMVDFSSTDRNYAIATAVTPHYLAGVAHNKGYQSVSFGHQGTNPDAHHFDYLVVNRNDENPNWGGNTDYHLPRVHKLITEIVPVPMTTAGTTVSTYTNKNRFPLFLRVGSGSQKTRASNGTLTDIAPSYQSLLGGSSPDPTTKWSLDNFMWTDSGLYSSQYFPLSTYGSPGDSGSPLYGYDAQEKRWVLVGVMSSYSGDQANTNGFTINRLEYLEYLQKNATGVAINNTRNNGTYTWTANGKTSTIRQPNGRNLSLDLADTSLQDSDTAKPSLDYGKNLTIAGKSATLLLANDINQGAGSLYVNTDVTVRSNNNSTWQGAGVIVENGKRLDWQVKNPQGDRLSKLGEGELWVKGSGENLGDISVGDGLVVLAQTADSTGKQQAFNQIGIVSGRPTVRLDLANQFNPDNLYFGFRGGRLDLNGQSLSFKHIQNVDDGAKIVNNSATKSSTITITGRDLYQESDLLWGNWREFGKDIYRYNYGKNTYYLALKHNPYMYYPTNGKSNDDWEVLATNNRQAAIDIALERKNVQKAVSVYNGYFGESDSSKTNGRLNVTFAPTDKHTLVLNGGMNLNGELSAKGGTLLLSGTAVQHAYDHQAKQDVVYENDWINRRFSANRLIAENNAKIYLGRNVTELQADIVASDESSLHLGFEQGKSLNCYYSYYSGESNCQKQAVLSAQNFANLPTTQIIGNVTLTGDSELRLGKAHLNGAVQASKRSTLALSSNAVWTNTANSKIGNLTLEQGSIVNLNNSTPLRFHSLIIDGNLSGSGRFNLQTNAAEGKGDHIQVNGTATGAFTLAINNSGKEPEQSSPLSLMKLNPAQKNNAVITLNNGYVDLGAYRYVLANQNGDYRLFNPLKAAKELYPDLVDSTAAEEAVKAALAEAARQHQNVKELTDKLNSQQQTVQSAQNTLSTAQTRLQTAQTELAKLKRINFVRRSRLNKEIQTLNGEISAAQNTLTQANRNLQSTQAMLANAQTLAEKADKAVQEAQVLAATAGIDSTLVQRICTNNRVSAAICSIFTNAEDGELQQRDWTSLYANAALSELSAQAHSVQQLHRNADRRLLEHNPNAYVWAATDHQRTEHESHLYRPYKQKGTLTQVGVETPLGNGLAMGAVFSHHLAQNDFDDSLNGKGKLNTATIYGKYRTQNGFTIALDGTLGRAKNRFDQNHFHRNYQAFGIHAGMDFDLLGLTMQPSVAARLHRFGKTEYELLDAFVETPKQRFTSYQAGVKIHKTFGSEWHIQPSVALYYVDASQRHLNVLVNGNAFEQRFGRYLHSEAAIHLALQRWQIGVHAGLKHGNELKRQRFAGAELRYSW